MVDLVLHIVTKGFANATMEVQGLFPTADVAIRSLQIVHPGIIVTLPLTSVNLILVLK